MKTLNSFIDAGADAAILKFIHDKLGESLEKGLNRSGLMLIDTWANGQRGTYRTKRWVRPNEAVTATIKRLSRQMPDGSTPDPVFIPISAAETMVSDAKKPPVIKTYTAREVVDKYVKETANSDIALRVWIKKNFFISDGENSTQDVYRSMDFYDTKRKKLHDKIISDILDSASDPAPGTKPIAILMGGGSASGKGYVKKNFVLPEYPDIKFGNIDADDIKGNLPEYALFQDQYVSSAAGRVHEESSDVTNRAIDELTESGKNFVYDGTMSKVDKYKKIIRKLHDRGYIVQIVNVATDYDTALELEAARAKSSGRKVPPEAVKESHRRNANGYKDLISLVDHYTLYQNDGKSKPEVIQNEKGTYNQELYNKFLEKGRT